MASSMRHGVFGHADGVSAGRVHDEHALARGGVEVHVVHAHAGAADHAKAFGLVQQLGRHLRRAADQQRIRIANLILDFPFRLGEIHDVPRGIGLQNSHHAFIDAVCNQNFHCPLRILLCGPLCSLW